MQCKQAQLWLFELVDGSLSSSLKNEVDQHLHSCDECSAVLQEIWEMNIKSSAWVDVEAPDWNHRTHFFGSRPKLPWLQLATTLCSIMLLAVVLFRVEVTNNESGFQVSFSGQNAYVSNQELSTRLKELELNNQRYVNNNLNTFATQQLATNQLILRTALDASRLERREDLGTVMSAWNQDREHLQQSTEDSMKYLLQNQLDDRRNIGNLTNVLKTISYQQDSNI